MKNTGKRLLIQKKYAKSMQGKTFYDIASEFNTSPSYAWVCLPMHRGGKKGFATMTKEEVQSISAKGGFSAHKQGVAHTFTSEEARKASYIAINNRKK